MNVGNADLSKPAFGINDAVLDWKILRGAERPFKSIGNISDILCFFSLVEAVAIYNKLWVSPKDLSSFKVFNALVDNGIILSSTLIPDTLSDSDIKQQFKNVASTLRHGEMARLSEVGAVDEAAEPTYARYIFACANRIDPVLDPVLTGYIPLVIHENTRKLTSRLSATLSSHHREQIEDLVKKGHPIRFYIPPAPAVILDRSGGGNHAKIIDELLSIREEFADFRARYAKYQDVISNTREYSPCEIVDAMHEGFYEVENAIKQLRITRRGSRLISRLVEGLFDTELEGSSESTISASVALGSVLKAIWEEKKSYTIRSRAQCLFDLWQSAGNVKGYGTLLERHFDLEEQALTHDAELVRYLGFWIDQQVGTTVLNEAA